MMKLNPYPWLVAVIVCGCLYAGHKIVVSMEVSQAVSATTLKLEKGYQDKLLAAASDARKTENKLELSALALEKVKDDEINRVNGKLADALSRLSKRPQRPTTPNNPQDAPTVQACTAGELYREDAEFLTREAARADQILAERNYYYQRYESVRKELNGINATN
jgi:hypothetical protein